MAWQKETLIDLLLEAGAIAVCERRELRFEEKPDRSIVTAADHAIEKLFISALEAPERGTYLIGEETVATKGESYLEAAMRGETYVVDPIDGTSPYAHRLPNWGISVGRMEAGALTDGAVYLPDCHEIFISEGRAVLHGRQVEGSLTEPRSGRWEWQEIDGPRLEWNPHTPVAITQALAKKGQVDLPNPVMVLGVAVVPMTGLLDGRFLAFLGSVKLWDVAGALPLLLRRGFQATVVKDGKVEEVTAWVDERAYRLEPGSRKRWAFHSDLLICDPGARSRFRGSFRMRK